MKVTHWSIGLKALTVALLIMPLVLLGAYVARAGGILPMPAELAAGSTGSGVATAFYVPNPPQQNTVACNNSAALFTLAVWAQTGAQTVSLRALAGGQGLVTLQAGGATATATISSGPVLQPLLLSVFVPAGDTQVSVTLAGPLCGQGTALTVQDLNLLAGP